MVRASIAALFLVVLSSADLIAAQGADKDSNPPGPTPDRIVLTWRKDPARTQSVTWRTDTRVTQAFAECKEVNAVPENTQREVAATTLFKSDLGEAHFHTVHFGGLTPDTPYAFRVGDGVRWSEWATFRTASDRPARFSFLYFGDAQYSLKERWAPVVRAALQAAPDARFSLHAGDLVNRGGSDAEWGEWFEAATPLNRTMPVIAVPGNHEYMSGQGNELPRYWSHQFPLPANGPPGIGGAFFLDFQGVRLVCLNTNEKVAEQVEWLQGVLENNPNRWAIVTFHHPLYSAAVGRDDPQLRKTLQPTFDKYRVDLVLQGHDHCYGRSDLLGHGGGPGATVYVVSVSGPQFYPVQSARWMSRWGEKLQLFQIITVDGDRLHFEARTAAGDLYDSFTLHKQAKGPNTLVNGPHDPRSVQPPRSGTESGTQDRPGPWVPLALIVLLTGALLALRMGRRRRG